MQNRVPTAPDERPPLPDFTPVSRRYRHDGWTPERQRAFIEALAETGSVKHAANRINMAKEGAYYLRLAPGSESFRAAWAAALDFGVQSLADIAIDRAREGVPVPVFYKGGQCGERRSYNDRLLMFILKHHMPNKYGADLARGTKHPDSLAREAEEAERESEAALAGIQAKVERIREHVLAEALSSRARVRRAFYDRYAHDPAKRAAWETLHERSIETLLGDAHDAAEADLRAAGAAQWPLLEDWRDAPDEDED